jgi:hypothetical protein
MAEHNGETFTSRRVDLDENAFENCTFKDCQIYYSGGEMSRVSGCRFEGHCTFHLDGAAARTLAYIRAMYHEMGPNGKRLVEETFNDLKTNPRSVN